MHDGAAFGLYMCTSKHVPVFNDIVLARGMADQVNSAPEFLISTTY
jgi:hypothetical protein